MGREILELLINFLVYLPVGDILKTQYADFIKVDSEFIRVDVKINTSDVIDTLEKSRIIRLV